MTAIHPSAVVDRRAELGADVEVGAFSVVGPEVRLADGVKVHSHAVVTGRTSVGKGCEIFPFASVGHRPQDLKFKGEKSGLEIGEKTVIREHVTLNPGTEGGGLLTKVGNGCLLMVGAHVAHDCVIGNNVILVNNATIAGHCVIGGLCAVHQFVRVGAHAFVGGMSGVENDLIPFGMALGNRAALNGLNIVGLKRHGFSRDAIHNLRRAYRQLFSNEGTLMERLDDVASMFGDDKGVQQIVEFIRAGKDRSLCVPRANNVGG